MVAVTFVLIVWKLKGGKMEIGTGFMEGAMGWGFEGLIQFPTEDKRVEGPSKLRAEFELVIRLPFRGMVRA